MMKKLFTLSVLTSLLIWSCKCDCTKDCPPQTTNTGGANRTMAQSVNLPAAVRAATSDERSLNGIDRVDAEKMIEAFEDNVLYQAKPSAKYSVWFNSDVITRMYALLKSEGATTGVLGKPDGFRIYFLANTTPSTPNFAIVSTQNNGKAASGRYLHLDYYKHDVTHKLFTTANLQGIISTNDNNGGARLYNTCSGPDCTLNCGPAPQSDRIVRRTYAEAIVRHGGKITFNTKSVWFDFDLLDKLNKLIAASQSTKPISGVRIYLSNYGRKGPDGNANGSAKLMRYTFLLTPTVTDGGIEKDIFNCLISKSVWESLQQTDDGEGGYNNGEICPTHCNADDGGDPGLHITDTSKAKKNK